MNILRLLRGRGWLIATDVLGSEEEYEDGSIDNAGAALDEEDKSDSGEAGVRSGVNQ